jgi:cell division protein FtsI (penicillin-binding protein 3)
MEEKRQILIKSYVMYVVVAIVMLIVTIRVINIQYGDVVPDAPMGSDSLTTGVTPTRVDSVKPMRGRILADDGSDLVTSIPLYDLHMDLTVVKEELFEDEVDSLAIGLAEVFDQTYSTKRDVTYRDATQWEAYLREGRSNDAQYHLLQMSVKYTILQKIKKLPILRESKYKGGFISEQHFERQKPNGLLAKRTLGKKKKGELPVGLEGAYDDFLTGEFGLRNKQYVNGSWKPVGADNLKDPIPGADVVTSINVKIQEVAENELKNQLRAQKAVHGSVVLMEVETGFIKAIANLNRDTITGKYDETYNHAVGTKTDPGSTFKLASLMALLEDGKVDISDEVGAYGEYHFYDHTTYDSHIGGYGKISIQHAFEVSSNVFSKIVNDAYFSDAQQYIDRLKSFGLGDTLGLAIAGEPMPVIKNRGEDGWSGITLPQMAIGYEVELTPIQILAFYNAVANDGEFVKPQFVKEIRRDDEVLVEYEKEVLNEKICSDETIAKLKKCLEGVVVNGTGKALQSSNFSIAGKTGTAKIVNSNKGYGDDYQASFVGYFPADEPKYSLIVNIAGPTKQIYGAQVSGTVFTAIADKVYASSPEYHPDFNKEAPVLASVPQVKYGSSRDVKVAMDKMKIRYQDKSQGTQWSVAISEAEKVSVQQRFIRKGEVPNVYGMPLNDAVYILENYGLRVNVRGHGMVVSQSQKAGSELIKGTQINLVLK